MNVLSDIPFRVNRKDLFKRLHLEEDSEFAGDLNTLATQADAIARPKAMVGEVRIDAIEKDGIRVGGVRFTSHVMPRNLRDVDRIYPYICTCGIELDAIPIGPGDDFGQFGLDIIKEMALRHAIAALNERIRLDFGLEKKANMNPGSGDRLLWPIEEQRPLFRLLGDVTAAIGVRLTDSFLMMPNKSVSGFFFKTDKTYHNCQLCKRADCPNRQAPFDQTLWDSSMPDMEADTTA
jgi:hypothetical protein